MWSWWSFLLSFLIFHLSNSFGLRFLWWSLEVFSEFNPCFLDGLEFCWPDFLSFSFGSLMNSVLFSHVLLDSVLPLLGGFLVSLNWCSPFVNNLLFVGPVKSSFTSWFTSVEMSVVNLEFDSFVVSLGDLFSLLDVFIVSSIDVSVWNSISSLGSSHGVSDGVGGVTDGFEVVFSIFFNSN